MHNDEKYISGVQNKRIEFTNRNSCNRELVRTAHSCCCTLSLSCSLILLRWPWLCRGCMVDFAFFCKHGTCQTTAEVFNLSYIFSSSFTAFFCSNSLSTNSKIPTTAKKQLPPPRSSSTTEQWQQFCPSPSTPLVIYRYWDYCYSW